MRMEWVVHVDAVVGERRDNKTEQLTAPETGDMMLGEFWRTHETWIRARL